ncbi:hypothetical protein AAF712_008991 [Marasmius tenuissimus]|uniref:Uncharacterized protein n=1 Tax=Marasmius tenuissimus TaxID=585030 RepID=A0ABR2ZR22_9AGAR
MIHTLQQVLNFLKHVLLRNPLFRTCRKLIWLLWSLLTRRLAQKRKNTKSDGDERIGQNRGQSGGLLGWRGSPRFAPGLESVPSDLGSTIICASEIPPSAHLDLGNSSEANPSQGLRPSSIYAKDDSATQDPSGPRISHDHPSTSSDQVSRAVDIEVAAIPAASLSRPSVNGPEKHNQEEIAGRQATSRSSLNVQSQSTTALEEPSTETPLGPSSRLGVDTTQLEEKQVPILGQELTSEPGTIRNFQLSQGYDLDALITTPGFPVKDEGHTAQRDLDIQTQDLREVFPDFFPMAPEIYYRYYKEDFIEPLATTFELVPMTTRFQEKRLPHGWREFIHPEGARYFLYEPKRTYTDADIYNPAVLRHARRLINEFDEYTRKRNITLPHTMNLTLDMFYEEEDDSCPCRYYIADHTSRVVFWLDKFNADEMDVWSEVKGVTEATHIHVLTSMSSTIPYTMDELQQMLTLTNNLRKNVESWRGVAAFARIMHIFVMFSAPDTHLRELGKIWVDRCIHKEVWNKFISNMNSEWQELILFGTVLLNANVAFLAIQSVDEATYNPHRSPAQVLSFLSVVSSIGSVIIGLMLARKNKVKHKEGASDAAIFLNSFEGERLGLETLAILYSVPYAFLMWG